MRPCSCPGARHTTRRMKKLLRIHRSSAIHWVGNGFPVRSVFDYNGLGRELSPFLLLDYAAPHPFPPGQERRGVGGHPHRGFETVTVAYQGGLEHRDSSGGGGKNGGGGVQVRGARRALLHEELPSPHLPPPGGPLHMPHSGATPAAGDKTAPPAYQTFLKEQTPPVALPQEAGHARLIAGEYDGQRGPARTFTRINLWDLTLRADKAAELPLPD